MKITQVHTIDAEFFEGVGTLPKTLTGGKKSKYPQMTIDSVEPGVGVKIGINGKSLIIPWGRIRAAVCVESSTTASK